jgi:hypothetical protein
VCFLYMARLLKIDPAIAVLDRFGHPKGNAHATLPGLSGVPESTLWRRDHGCSSIQQKGAKQPYLTTQEEKALQLFGLLPSASIPVRRRQVGHSSSTSSGTWGITVYSDSMSALQAITNPRHQSGQSLIRQAAKVLWESQTKERRIRLAWLPGHAGIPGNEAADRLAATTTTPESAVVTRRGSGAGSSRWC